MREILVQIPSNTSGETVYCPAFDDCTVLSAKAVINGDHETAAGCAVSLMVGDTTLGTVTFPDESSAGDVLAITMSATLATRKTKVTAAAPLKVVCAAQDTAAAYDVLIRFDDSALTRD